MIIMTMRKSNMQCVVDALKARPLTQKELRAAVPHLDRRQVVNAVCRLISLSSVAADRSGVTPRLRLVAEPDKFRAPHQRPREIHIRRGSSSGVVAPAPYHRGSFWGAGLV